MSPERPRRCPRVPHPVCHPERPSSAHPGTSRREGSPTLSGRTWEILRRGIDRAGTSPTPRDDRETGRPTRCPVRMTVAWLARGQCPSWLLAPPSARDARRGAGEGVVTDQRQLHGEVHVLVEEVALAVQILGGRAHPSRVVLAVAVALLD